MILVKNQNPATFLPHALFERVNHEQFQVIRVPAKAMVEVVGIEPTSKGTSIKRTTCVALNYCLKAKTRRNVPLQPRRFFMESSRRLSS